MNVDYCSLFVCTILIEIIINFFNDINFKLQESVRKKFINKDSICLWKIFLGNKYLSAKNFVDEKFRS